MVGMVTIRPRGSALLDRHAARLLDPRREVSGGRFGVRTATAYRADTLMIRGGADLQARARTALELIRPGLASTIAFDGHRLLLSGAAATGPRGLPAAASSRTQSPDGSTDLASAPIDAWSVLAALRAIDPDLASAFTLNHLLSVAEQAGGNPLAIAHGRPGLDHYGQPSFPGRGPVSWTVPVPRRGTSGRRPRVVVLDTGIGEHPWFIADPAVTQVLLPNGITIGPQVDPGESRPPDGVGDIPVPLLGALGTHAGHGTFIAGLIRQTCPDAEIVALAVMGADGMVPEDVLTTALTDLADKQEAETGWADALVLSLGYYAESTADLVYTTRLKQVLLRLARAGVAIFCAAGNDATTRESFPAAFADDPDFADREVVPLAAVAALTARGDVAEFSNDGPWVNADALGVSLVSSAPTSAQGSTTSSIRVTVPGRRIRSAADPDSFESGFASWSGTSFAAPVLAGKYLCQLIAAGFPVRADQRRSLMPLRTPRSP